MKKVESIYLDHQATTPLDSQVLAAMRPHLAEGFGNPHAVDHAIGWQAARAVEDAAMQVGALIGADPDEIIFTSGATEANNLALLGLARRASRGARRRVLLSAIEHKSVLALGRVLEEQLGYRVSYLSVDQTGLVDLESLEHALGEDVLAVSVMAVNNEIGTIQDIQSISRMAAKSGSLLHCDAAQAPCATDISSYAEHVDLLSLSGHKMYGPMGIGALYIRREIQNEIEPLIYGGGQQYGLRSGTVPTALCVGMGRASELAAGSIGERDRCKVARARDFFADLIMKSRYDIWVNGPTDADKKHPGNLNVGFRGVVAADLLSRIQPRLAASTGSACTSGTVEPSHVLRAIGLSSEEASSCVRFSIGKHTTDDDIVAAVNVIEDAIEEAFANAF